MKSDKKTTSSVILKFPGSSKKISTLLCLNDVMSKCAKFLQKFEVSGLLFEHRGEFFTEVQEYFIPLLFQKLHLHFQFILLKQI